MQPCLAGCQAPPPLRTSWAVHPERLGRTVTALEQRGAPEAAVEQACPVVSHHGMSGGGQGVRESQEDIQDRSQGGSVVPDGVLQGLRGESPGLDLVQPCFP